MSIEIIVQTIDGREHGNRTISVNVNDTIGKAKEKYGQKEFQWKYCGSVLKDNKLISDYDIEDGDIIMSNKLAQGGGPSF